MNLNTIGIDIAKAQFDVFETNGQKHTNWFNSPQGIKALVKHLIKLGECQVILEATGRYHKALEKALSKAGIAYSMVNPWQARRFSEASGMRAKTDKVDARMLALMGTAMKLKPTVIRDDVIETLSEFELCRLALVEQRAACKNREKILTNTVVKKSVARQLKYFDKELEKLVQAMEQEMEKHSELKERFALLQTIPGIGSTTAMSLLIGMPELGELRSRKISALAGLAPMTWQSGTSVGKARIKGGRFGVRKALYMPAIIAIQYNPDLKAFYRRLRDAGKPSKVALTAVMRKLLILANALLRDQREWTPKAPKKSQVELRISRESSSLS